MKRFSNRTIERVLDAVDLRALAEDAGARFGHNSSSICPLHVGSDNPSAFHVYDAQDGRQRWHCFTRCPEGANGGDAIAFYEQWRNVDFVTAVKELALVLGVDIEYDDDGHPGGGSRRETVSTMNSRPAIGNPAGPPGAVWRERARAFVEYARAQLWSNGNGAGAALGYLIVKRGLNEDTLREWGLGYNPRDIWDQPGRWGLTGKRIWLPRGIVIPGVRDGDVWYVKVRRPLPGDELALAMGAVDRLARVKFSGPRGGRAVMFGAGRMREELPVLLLVEGEWDGMLCYQEAGDLCNVGSLGGAKHRVDMDDALILMGAGRVLACYDMDDAGAEGLGYLREVSPRVRSVRLPANDVTDYWREGGDVRRWLAGLVAEEMEVLLERLDDRQNGGVFRRWLELYEATRGAADGVR